MTNDVVIKILSNISAAAGYLDSIGDCKNEYSLEQAKFKIDTAIKEILDANKKDSGDNGPD